MKAALPASPSSDYSIRVGSEDCRVRGIEIELIESIFPERPIDGRSPADIHAPWVDVTEPDEIVVERMVMPPLVRKRSRSVASRAILLGSCD